MATTKRFLILIVILISTFNVSGDNDLTRGHHPGELYLASTWFQYLDTITEAFLYTADYGKSLTIRYYWGWSPNGSSDMVIGRISTDSNVGVIYNANFSSLWRSDDFGYTWDSIHPLYQSPYAFYTAGSCQGEVYCKLRKSNGDSVGLYRSQDFGQNFMFQSDSAYGNIEVATETGCLYNYLYYSVENEIIIRYSTDRGVSFDTIACYNSDTIGSGSSIHFPIISRGNTDGELYLVTLYNFNRFRIFYSQDWGQSLELKYISDEFDPSLEHFSFTAGNEPGSFFFSKMIPLYNQGPNTMLCVYHSEDTAQTFTEHCHLLDTSFTVSVSESSSGVKTIGMKIYPNPVGHTATLKLDIFKSEKFTIEVFNISGMAVLQEEKHLSVGLNEVILNTAPLNPGVYICSIKTNGRVVGVQKFIKRE